MKHVTIIMRVVWLVLKGWESVAEDLFFTITTSLASR